MNFDQLITRIENSKPIDFGNTLSKSFELSKQHLSQGVKHMLVLLAINLPLMLVVLIPLVPIYIEMIMNSGDSRYYSELPFLRDYSIGEITVWYIVVLILSFVTQIISVSVFAHFFKYLKKEDLGEDEEVGGYFTLLKTHFNKILLLTLATTGIAIIASLLCVLPIYYVIIPLHWIFPIFIFNKNLSTSEIIKAAFKFGNKNWLMFALTGWICSMIASLGVYACYVGILFTGFFTYVATYVAYRDTIGFETPEQIEKE